MQILYTVCLKSNRALNFESLEKFLISEKWQPKGVTYL